MLCNAIVGSFFFLSFLNLNEAKLHGSALLARLRGGEGSAAAELEASHTHTLTPTLDFVEVSDGRERQR